ncbi:hypothetical protein J8273_6501 [Carpediemonas membranifera]|uniref:J domain-containing protein n=1 Tax=Carpediemonas membranifera TaxID=201153 RepID=A0A8J6AU97_9EUKA|nr:hypothetical protein J8273_6501 [Carpediemonas membranifera]|eukprot:KAG9391725.1 hypothetical protein J8273_6501 [Carpediemonas membranifera]
MNFGGSCVVVYPSGKESVFSFGTRFSAVCDDVTFKYQEDIIAVRVDHNQVRSLNESLESSCYIEPLYATSPSGIRVISESVRFVLEIASHDLFPHKRMSIVPTMSGIHCTFDGGRLSPVEADTLAERVSGIITSKFTINCKDLAASEARKWFNPGQASVVVCAVCGSFVAPWRPLIPHTGHLAAFPVSPKEGGVLVQTPVEEEDFDLEYAGLLDGSEDSFIQDDDGEGDIMAGLHDSGVASGDSDLESLGDLISQVQIATDGRINGRLGRHRPQTATPVLPSPSPAPFDFDRVVGRHLSRQSRPSSARVSTRERRRPATAQTYSSPSHNKNIRLEPGTTTPASASKPPIHPSGLPSRRGRASPSTHGIERDLDDRSRFSPPPSITIRSNQRRAASMDALTPLDTVVHLPTSPLARKEGGVDTGARSDPVSKLRNEPLSVAEPDREAEAVRDSQPEKSSPSPTNEPDTVQPVPAPRSPSPTNEPEFAELLEVDKGNAVPGPAVTDRPAQPAVEVPQPTPTLTAQARHTSPPSNQAPASEPVQKSAARQPASARGHKETGGLFGGIGFGDAPHRANPAASDFIAQRRAKEEKLRKLKELKDAKNDVARKFNKDQVDLQQALADALVAVKRDIIFNPRMNLKTAQERLESDYQAKLAQLRRQMREDMDRLDLLIDELNPPRDMTAFRRPTSARAPVARPSPAKPTQPVDQPRPTVPKSPGTPQGIPPFSTKSPGSPPPRAPKSDPKPVRRRMAIDPALMRRIASVDARRKKTAAARAGVNKVDVDALAARRAAQGADPTLSPILTQLSEAKPWLDIRRYRTRPEEDIRAQFDLSGGPLGLDEGVAAELSMIERDIAPQLDMPRERKTDVQLLDDARLYNGRTVDFLRQRVLRRNPRERLGLGPRDGPAEARAQYRKLVLLYHPDRAMADHYCFANEPAYRELLHDLFKAIDEAYRVLTV